jgi:hypothetical protein
VDSQRTSYLYWFFATVQLNLLLYLILIHSMFIMDAATASECQLNTDPLQLVYM